MAGKRLSLIGIGILSRDILHRLLVELIGSDGPFQVTLALRDPHLQSMVRGLVPRGLELRVLI